MILNRTITTLQYSSNGQKRCTVLLNPHSSEEEAIVIDYGERRNHRDIIMKSFLLASGFRKIASNDTMSYFLSCPEGTFTNSSADGKLACTACPPGGFYSDVIGLVAPSCKKCPNGSFVHFDKAPGTQAQDCKSCPPGTETDFFAGYRACRCLEGFYRTDMFGKCYKCIDGLQCKDEYASLKSGYWWKWRNKTQKARYMDFIKNLQLSLPLLGADDVRYPYPIPTAYRCPIEESCIGGLDSPCKPGYDGPLCAVCGSGYYKQLQTCKQCPSKEWIVGKLSIVVAIVLIIIGILAWTRKRNKDDDSSIIDMFLSKVKIVIGFYQVTYGLLETFSYIDWPGSLQVIGKYSEVLQMNVLQIAPVHCLYQGLQLDAFGNLFVMMAINATVIGLSGVAYGIRRVVILRSRSATNDEKSRKLSQTKEFVYRNMFFFLYTTYLNTCLMTANVLPLTCRKLCEDENEEFCNNYLKADYRIHYQSPRYNHALIAAYISVTYLVAIPAASFIALWRQRRVLLASEESEKTLSRGPGQEMITGLSFLFKSYKPHSWYWELVEMSRKVILTYGLILVGEESRSYIGLTWTIAGMYGILFCRMKPIQDGLENRMMSTSLAVTVFNLAIGAVSRIPAEKVSSSSEPYMQGVIFSILVVGANALVIGLPVFQYMVGVYRYYKEWRKNPQWSISCCLALLLPVNDLQGEASGLAATDVLKSQLNTGNMKMSTILITFEDNGDTDVNPEEKGTGDDQCGDVTKGYRCTTETQDVRCNKKCTQGTQTELLTHSVMFH